MYCLFIAISLWHFCQLAHFTCFPLCCIRLDFLKAKLSLIKHKITSLLHCRHFYWKSTLTDQVFGCTRKFENCLSQKKSSSKCYFLECEAPPPWLLCLAILSCPSQVLMPLASLAPGLGLMTWCCRGLPADSHGRPSASGLGLSRCGSRSHDQTSEDGGTGERRVDRRGRHWRQGEKSETFHLLLGTSITSYSQDGKQVGKEVQKELVRKF